MDVHEEIKEEAIEDDTQKPGKNPLYYISALFLILILIFWLLPISSIKLDPEPNNIPELADILPDESTLPNITRPNGSILAFVDSTDPLVKQIATKIATESCESSKENYKVCQAKAVFYFVRDNFEYVGEQDDYIQTPVEMLYTKGGDCDDFSVILASMESSIGIPVRFISIPRHVYVQVYLEDAHSKYKEEDGWINVDATCSSCDFGKTFRESEQRRVIW